MSTDDQRVTEQDIFEAKWYLNGFPKSGTHMLVQLVRPVANLNPGTERGLWRQPWAGTFDGNSWTNEWMGLERTCFKAGRLRGGHILKAHSGYCGALERFLYLLGTAHVFIYRDPRDVAVSQAHHILSAREDDHLAHPEPELYEALGGFDEVLEAVIVGLGRYPGVMARWEMYAPWLDVDWVLSVRFEDVRTDPERWAKVVLRYGLNRTAGIWGHEIEFEPSGFEAVTAVMANATRQRDKSPTFRKGEVGGWREAFTERHRRLFQESDSNGWLVRLGYEETEDWVCQN